MLGARDERETMQGVPCGASVACVAVPPTLASIARTQDTSQSTQDCREIASVEAVLAATTVGWEASGVSFSANHHLPTFSHKFSLQPHPHRLASNGLSTCNVCLGGGSGGKVFTQVS